VKKIGIIDYWNIGILEYWNDGMMQDGSDGIMEYWNSDLTIVPIFHDSNLMLGSQKELYAKFS
jgi:hypothetical protein